MSVNRPIEDIYPLSPMQQGMLFHSLMAPDHGLYIWQLSCRLEGELDLGAFRRALQRIVERHAVLRTSFLWEDLDQPVQIVTRETGVPLEEEDWSGLDPDEQRERLESFLREDLARGFDLQDAPLMRLLLAREGTDRYRLVWSMHILLLDGWSITLVMGELFRCYEAFRQGRDPGLGSVPRFRDYIAWLQRQDPAGAELFWRRELAGFAVPTPLPGDRGTGGDPDPGRFTVRLSEETTAALQAFARGGQVTLNTLIQAAWSLLLARTTGERDLVFGVTVSGRPADLPGVESMVGLFINTVPLRVRLTEELPLRDWLRDLQERQVESRQHEHIPLPEVQGWSEVPRGVQLFESLVVFENRPAATPRDEGSGKLAVDDVRLANFTNYPLVLVVEPGARLHLHLDVDRGRFGAEAPLLLARFQDLLEQMAWRRPERLGGFLRPGPAELQQLLLEWNDSESALPAGGAGVEVLFTARAAETPEAVAAECGDRQVSYRELAGSSERLARALAEEGIGPESRVALLAERGIDFLTAVLGIFRAGGAYLPLDPHHPRQRLAALLADSGVELALADQRLFAALAEAVADLPAAARPRLRSLEELLGRQAGGSGGRAALPGSAPNRLAYVIYTSGSTGMPKGAMVEHRGMLNHLWAKVWDLGLGPGDVVAQTASQCFDISVWQFLAALLAGGRVRILPDAVAHDPQRLLAEVEHSGITVLETVPSLLRLALDELERQGSGRPALDRLRWLIPTGEAMPPELCRQWLRLYPAIPLLNAYGPTECSDDVSHHPIRPGQEPERPPTPIGRPVANLRLYVLDGTMTPLPAAVLGELFVGGAGVGRGYLGDGARTAQAFLPDPFAGSPGSRLYRTGDLARWRPDGRLEFLGRVDQQVKIRGFRIEPGEVEAVLAEHPEVRAAAVIVREDTPGQKRLAAYVVPRRDEGSGRDRVGQWEAVFDEIYGTGPQSEQDAGINLRVWISSYTGEPLPENEIVECFEDSVARILALRPSRVLEIGCGTGLLLLRIAPQCTAFTGTDLSEEALRSLRGRVAGRGGLPPVELLHRAADDFTDLPPGAFDVVVLNEVAQYFPSVEYLVRVVEGAVAAAAPGGTVFLGGLRSFPLLEAFHTSVELFRSPAGRPLAEVREAARRRLAQDKELAVDPVLFEALARRLPRVADLSIQLKGGRVHNELTRFRYDVVLRIAGGPEPARSGEPRQIEWQEGWTLEELRRTLAEAPEALALHGVPNARLRADLAALRRLRDSDAPGTAGKLLEEVAAVPGGVEPADLWDLAAALGLEAEIRWSLDEPERLDALFYRSGERPLWPLRAAREEGAWSRYANRPERGGAPGGLLPQLRTFASERLPDWMVPAAWMLLDELPLTSNGKLDRKALPLPEATHSAPAFVPPQGPTEELLASIWAEVLGVEQVGARDHFFELGGHSLLAIQVMSRLRSAFGIELPLRVLFEAPLLADLAAQVETELRAGASLLAPPLVPVPREGPLPVSFAQQRLWFIDQLTPGSPLYNMPVALRAEGPLDLQALDLCLSEIVRRHETLRTVFAVRGDTPVQVIQPAAPFRLARVDLSGLPESRREALALTLVGEESARPFDLGRGPLLRGLLLRLAENDHAVVLTMHHIVSDGWSMGILVREVSALYPAFAQGRPPALPELPVQYADFAAWQASWLQGEVLEAEIDFWRQRLAGLPPLLELPTDRPRPAVQSFQGAARPVWLPPALVRQAQALSRQEGATLFMVLLAAFQALLARYSGQDDLAVGTPVAGRNREEIEGLIGFFVNTLVLRGDLAADQAGGPSFRTLLGRARETALAAFLHQDLPFEKLVEELAPERSLAHSPLFQVLVALQNAPVEDLEIQDLRLRPVGGTGTMAKFDLALSVAEHGGGLYGVIEHATELFDRTTIDRLIGHLESLLAAALAAPERSALELPLLTGIERHQLQTEWNDTAVPAAPGVVELFEEQARRTPEAVAVALAGGAETALTYRELDRRADLLAGRLRALGVGPEVPVGLCVEQTPDLAVAVLGIFKSGGALLALDPAHPPARLAFLLQDAAAPVLVTRSPLLEGLPVRGVRTVLLEDAEAGEESRPRGARPAPRDLAYLIYTSGTTGQPKAVLVEHGMLAATLEATRESFRFAAGDRMPCLALPTFDISLFELLSPLLTGGTAVLFPLRPTLDVEHLVDHLGELTVLHAVPALMRGIVESLRRRGAEAGGLGRMRAVFVGGDTVPAELLDDLRETFPAARVWVLYGPTEGTILCAAHPVPPPPAPARPLLGRPLAGAVLDIRDASGELLPAGVPGELWIGGAGVTRGYLRREELTAEKYVLANGRRFYRSGDRARRLADGTLEFLGRLDHQVKIRGFRIEPGEIEAALSALPGVREAAVVAREDRGAADRRLVAYVAGDAAPDALRQSLRERLPEYMLPAAFVILAELPRTPNGKLDRKALPAPEWQRSEEGQQRPRTPVEEVLAGIWAELLGLERVEPDDDFFHLGGHSLLAAQMMSRLRGAFGVEVPLRDLFEAPVLVGFATRVEAALSSGADRLAPPLAPLPREGALPLSFAQQRLWFIDQLEPGSPLYNMPVALRVEGPLRPAVLALCLGEIVRRHEALRTVFTAREGAPVQVIRPAAPFVLPVVDLSGLPRSRREAQALLLTDETAVRPFDLARGPLLRSVLLRLSEDEHIVALTLHHIASDGWSMGVLVREVAALYPAFAEGRPSPLPELPVQYADFAAWQHSWLRGEVLESEIAFWRQQLAGLPPLLELPTDRPRPAQQSFRGASRPVRLPLELTRQAQTFSQREGATLFMVLLAGFQALLARSSGQHDLAVGSPFAGRNRTEIEGLIGFFVNTLVLRGDLSGEPSFRALLGRVRETVLAAWLHQDVPFEKLVEELAPPRSLAHAPLAQVMLVLQNAPAGRLEIRDLRLQPVSGTGTTAKLDLTVSLEEHGGALIGAVEYASDLFDAVTIDRLVGQLERFLAAAVAAPERSAFALPLLGDAERGQILIEWNDTAPAPAPAACLHELVAEQARRTPEAVALLDGAREIRYRELEQAAGRLAARLRQAGAGPEMVAGVYLERSAEMVVALLAILQSGAAYLPLDPRLPRPRLAGMLADARAALVVSDETLAAGLPWGGPVVLVDQEGAEDGRARRGARIDPENLAYVLFTSGSTGTPKGVAVTHRSAVALVRWAGTVYAPKELAGVLAATAISFDLSVFELFVPLSHGGTVILARNVLELPALLSSGPAAGRVTLVNTVPSALSELVRAGGLGASVCTVNLAGEPLPRELADRLYATGTVERVWNLYGPSEDTTYSTASLVPREGATAPGIGRPIAATQARVLDTGPDREILPAGVPGELYLGGSGLARGYLHRPDLTAERFLPDPFAEAPGARLYRTGDRVRWTAAGELEFLGRFDQQVKVRGFRIELGEVEAALGALPGVREAAVLALGEGIHRRLTAFVVLEAEGAPGIPGLRQALRDRLPEAMVPEAWKLLPEIPLTPHSKVDRRALAQMGSAPDRPAGDASAEPPRTRTERLIAAAWRELLGLSEVGRHDNFFDLGGHSLLLVRLQEKLRSSLGREVALLDLFRYPTVDALARFLAPEEKEEAPATPLRPVPRSLGGDTRIAIIGMSGRFPGAANIEELWSNLRGGVESVVELSEEELLSAGVDPEALRNPRYVRAAARLDGVQLFDADFFGFTPRDAEITDPQCRLFLEAAWEAFERGGYDPRRYPGRVGVYSGVQMSTYLFHLHRNPEVLRSAGYFHVTMANDKDHLATTVAYKMNLRGPSLAVQTACSSSLVATHLACRSLAAGDCDMALAGGAAILWPQSTGYFHQEGGIQSPDGHCRAFDARAQGTLRGSGVGVVLLKRLADALADGDPIHAVILGSAVNNDGSFKIGYTAPSVEGQAQVIADALAESGVDPRTITYVEAHGSATALGDPIEVAALTQAFRAGTADTGFCALGSVKTNMGHLDTAAGVTGLIKTALALEHKTLPPSLHFEEPNPQIDFAASPFFVNAKVQEWTSDGGPRRAGVSSFGLGGTNAHVILEEAPPAEPSGPSRPWQLLLVSARTPEALERATDNLAAHLEEQPEQSLPDVAYTLRVGRGMFAHRRAIVAASAEEAATALRSRDAKRVWTGGHESGRHPVAFLLPGVGDQYPGMARGLYDEEPVFRREIDLCAELLLPHLGLDLRDALFAAEEARDLRALLGRGGDRGSAARALLRETRVAQPAMFAVGYALARLWMSWGVQPQAVLGYSLGELTAACLAGVMGLPDALALVAGRARLIGELAPGAMLAVPLSEEETRARLGPELSLAAVNAPQVSVVAGPSGAIAALESRLAAEGLPARRLQTDQAFHSWMMQPIAEALLDLVRSIPLAPPRIAWLSNVTGTWIEPGEATDPAYWVRHLVSTVRFADALAELWREPGRILLEMGPGQTLGSLALQQIPAGDAADRAVLSTLRHELDRQPDQRFLLHTLGRLWLAGAAIDWSGFHGGEHRRRVVLPTYPFERQRYWIEPADTVPSSREGAFRPDRLSAPGTLAGRWLVLLDPLGLGDRLAQGLAHAGCEVATAQVGPAFSRIAPRSYTLDPHAEGGFDELFADLGAVPDHVLHLWSLDAPEERMEAAEALARGYRTLIALSRALARREGREPVEICVVGDGLCDVENPDPLHPMKVSLLGPLRGIPREHPEISCRLIDVDAGEIGQELETRLLAALAERHPEPVVSWRGGPREEPVRPQARRGNRRPSLPTSWIAPSNATEETVAALWEELLGIDPIGARDDFFQLGGHSLLGLQLVSRLRARLGVELPLQALFEAPTVADLAARIEAEREAGTAPLAPPLVPVPRQGPVPLSFAQQRLWFIDQLEPGSSLYNMPTALRAEGPLDTAVLALCLTEIVRRHATLRTVFATVDDAPVQVIRPAAPFRLPLVDVAGLPEGARETVARTLAREEAARPFDLTRDPLLRCVLLRLAAEDHLIAMTMHHIASDGWSTGILVREVTALYPAFAAGQPSPLPELPVQYADFSAWQHSWLRGEVLEDEIAFWRQQLAGLPPLLELPTDRPRPGIQSFRGAVRQVRMPVGLTQQMQALSRSEGTTLFMLLLAGFQILLARSSGQQDLATGTPIAGRNRVEIEGLIGFFVNTLVLRGSLAGDPSFRELLGRVRATTLAAHTHQDVPFEKLVQELAPERSLAQTPLFQVMFSLQNAVGETLEIPNLRLRQLAEARETSKFDLTLGLGEWDGGLVGRVEYATDLFDATTIDRLIDRYERLLAAALDAPERRASELPFLSPAEHGQILAEWNDTAAATPRASVYGLFEAQARRTPDALAVVFGNEELTYAELAFRSGRLARHLRRLGVGPDVLVGLMVERSLDMIVGALGILQAGGAYVPLDPQYPEQRLAFMLEDTRSPVLLTQEPLLGRLPAGSSRIVLLDGGDVEATGAGEVPHSSETPDESLAYVIYTSGSTGRPKGVALAHRPLRNLVEWHLATLLGGVPTLQFASLSFDASFHEMFACWGSGGTLVVVPEELRRDLPALARLLVERRIEKAILPVVVLQQLAEIFAGQEELPPLREITTTGERLQTNRAMGALLRRLPGCAFHNHYGPSETHVATACTLRPDPEEWAVHPPIGRPIWNSTTYVLEPGLTPAPVGVPGDLYIGGACLARGYLGRPDLTAWKFVPDPFAAEPGARLYRTGDKVRLLASGDLEFLGRFDDQVKIRGFRIEPGEIEQALAALPGVREAAVVVRDDGTGEGSAGRRLVAYVAGDVTADALRQALRERLPDYMVPAAFVQLAALPLTPNGKVDRRALPAPEWQDLEAAYVPPRTPVEEILAGIWAEILGLERVGANGRFFDLGGHSLLATRVMSRLRSTFDIEMLLRDLFEAPVLSDFAVRVEAARRAGAGRTIPPLVPIPRDGALPLSFGQQRLWLLHQMDPLSPAYNMPFGFRLSGRLDVAALAASLTEVVRRHETLRTTLVTVDGEPRQSIAPPARQPLPVIDLSALPAERREELGIALGREEAARPFDLSRPPVVRTLLLRLDPREHALFFTIHHVTSDGWSIEVLSREVTELYGAAAEGRPSRLPELAIQYADFAVWQRGWLQGEVLQEQIEYWRQQLAGAPALLEMPLDRPRPPVQSFRGGRCRLQIPPGLTGELFRLGRSREATAFMTVLAAFQALLYRYSGQESVVVGTPVANRERAELEKLIGFFANTLPMRTDFAGDPSFAGLLGRVREMALGAYGHQDLPFEKLVDELAPRRDMSYAPVFQALFVYQSAPQQQQAAGPSDLTLGPFGADEGVARFDLTLVPTEIGSGLGVHLDYNADLFEEPTARRMLRLFGHLLERVAAEPQRPLGDLPLLDEEEHRQVVLAANATACPRSEEELSLHGLFERQAALTPEAPAVVERDGVVRYGELAEWAGRIAERLERLGIGPEDRVGICLERSAAALAALLGTLRAGAAYVPLDPEWPLERLLAVAADAGLAAVLTRAGLEAGLAPYEVRVEDLRQGAGPQDGRVRPATPDAAAYVIYTSGSTGAAKGVVATHRGAANFVLGMAGTLGLVPADRLLLFAPLSFDASVLQIFPPLACGAALVIHPNPRELTAQDILDLCERHGVTVLDLPAALWRQWVEEVAAARLPLPASLRSFLTGGESVPVARLRTWAALAGRTASFLSSYGPTEATVTTTVWQTTSDEATALTAPHVPIGRPLPNARVYVLDPRLQPVPRGVAGELFLGGAGLARGYLGRPDLTAEVFVPDPLSGEPGGRLYRTGDLGRSRPDGDLEFLGRADHQVKIRGFRVELGEIEVALARFPGVRQAVVAVRDDLPGNPRLVGYVLPRDSQPVDAAQLRAFLAERLPAYMVPVSFVVLAELPVLASGKVDRAALPAPAESAASFVAPRNPLEQVLAETLAEVLKVEQVGAFDNFFELGGDSLTATQALARIRQTFDIDFQLRNLFEEPTVAGLAEALRRSGDGEKVEEMAALRVELAGLSDEEVEARLLAEATADEGFQP